MGEDGRQMGIGLAVIDQETGIDRMTDAVHGHIDGIGVAAEICRGFVEGHLVLLRQQPGRGEAGDSRTDDSDPLAGAHAHSFRLRHCAHPCRRSRRGRFFRHPFHLRPFSPLIWA
jgi:hypothetical protein